MTTMTRLPQTPQGSSSKLRDGVSALLAGVAVLALGVGLPTALWLFVGNPLPTTLPSTAWLNTQISATVLINVLSVVVWLAWAHFIVCLVTEWVAARRGRLPAKVALGGGNQLLARRLVAAVLLIGGAATMAPLNLAHQAPPSISAAARAGTSVQADVGSAQQADASRSASSSDASSSDEVTGGPVTVYHVEPPRGRHHDCLWDIAERTLGDPLRYKEIFALNHDRVQADGRRMVDKDLIQPGWILRMPDDAKGPGVSVHRPAVTPVPGQRDTGQRDTGPRSSGTSGRQAPADALAQHRTGVANPRGAGVLDSIPGDALLGGGLMLAGLLTLLSTRRGPYGAPDARDARLRLAADPGRVELIDLALRNLAGSRDRQNLPMPEVLLAFVAVDELVLHLAAPADAPPAPWTADGTGRSWRLRAADLPPAPDDAARRTPAPYPALANIAATHGFEVLVDLESAPGLISLGGDPGTAREVAVSLAVELATNSWSDGVGVTLVGFGDDLVELAPGGASAGSNRAGSNGAGSNGAGSNGAGSNGAASRGAGSIEQVDRLDQVLDDVERQFRMRTDLIRSLGVDGVLSGRSRAGGEPWRPRVVVLSGPPTPAESQRLQELIGTGRTPLAVVCVGDNLSARWRFVVAATGTVELGPLGVHGTARRLPRAEYSEILALLRAADATRASAARVAISLSPRGTDEEFAAVGAGQADVGGAAAVGVRLLGPVSLESAPGSGLAGDVDPARLPLLTEVVVAAALHRDGLHDATLRAAVWPRGVEDDVVEQTVAQVRRWLGDDPSGRPRMRRGVDGRFVLGDDVRTDWDVFRVLATRASGDQEYRMLRQALGLGAGEIFSGYPAGRYGWLAFHQAARAARALTTSVTRRAGALALAGGSPAEAIAVVRAGLAMVPTSEVLWRDLLKLHAGGDDPASSARATRSVANEMDSVLLSHGVKLPEPETDALVEALVPGYSQTGG